MKNIAFIINSDLGGTQLKRKMLKLLNQYLDHTRWTIDVVFSQHPGHAEELARQFGYMDYDAVVAVGGDGTVAEVATGLMDTQTAMGIIPVGKQNRFARHFGVPERAAMAIEWLNQTEAIYVDYAMLTSTLQNGNVFARPLFSQLEQAETAHASFDFQEAGRRGAETVAAQLSSVPLRTIGIESEGMDIQVDAYALTIANTNQWGTPQGFAPRASIQDGMLDINILSSEPIAESKYMPLRDMLHLNTLTLNELTLHCQAEGEYLLDGEQVHLGKDIHLSTHEDGLRVLVKKRY